MEMTIGANIKRLRTAKNITQEQLSVAMNVTCAAVSKWERGETYPDITLLQPLAYFFEVTLDELMGYDQKRVQADIDETIALYRKHWKDSKGREIIVKAYHDYPNDYRIMHYYMWNIGGDMADNNPTVLIEHKEEFLSICEKILGGCTEDALRLGAWNMRAKILHAEGKTDEALRIYQTKFADWCTTSGQKTEQLFAKDTDEYYFHVRKNMYELGDFAADKLGRTVFFDPALSMSEKVDRAILYGNLMLNAYRETKEAFLLMLAESFLGRIENDLFTTAAEPTSRSSPLWTENFTQKKLLEEARGKNAPLNRAFDSYSEGARQNILRYTIACRTGATDSRRAELLKKSEYIAVLDKYR